MQLTTQQKIDRIYEVMSDKTQETLYSCKRVREAWNYGTMTQDDFEQVVTRVMIGDVLQYVEKDYNRFTQWREIKEDIITGDVDYSIDRITYKILELRTLKTEPINNQSDMCIEFIYSIAT